MKSIFHKELVTISEVADVLRISPAEVFEILSDPCQPLTVAYVLPCMVEAVRFINGHDPELVKLFGVVIVNEYADYFRKCGLVSLSVPLRQDYNSYLLCEIHKPVSVDDIFVTSESLNRYMVAEGYIFAEEELSDTSLEASNVADTVTIPSSIDPFVVNTSDEKFNKYNESAIKLSKTCSGLGEIAYKLQQDGASLYTIGQILKKDGIERSRDAWEKKAKRLIGPYRLKLSE
jgi:hypothetical protein